jgi:Xaa-Pro aminopeptidase
MEHRIQRLRTELEQRNLDAILIMEPLNRKYITGFTGSAGVAVVTKDQAVLITDFRYTEQAKGQSPHFRVEEHAGADFLRAACDVLKRGPVRTVAFESDFLSYNQFHALQEVSQPLQLVPMSGIVETLRQFKDEHELEIMKTAAKIADDAFLHIVNWIRPGVTEKEVALELEIFMRKAGATSSSFDTIVASGPRSALPHGVASDKVIEKHEFVKLDFGALYKGYCSDITRTICLGKPNDKHKQIYDIVLEAQLKALEGIKPGMTGKEADAIARDWIAKHGYGEYFGHSLGHGLGMAVHEKPALSKLSNDVLQPGMVVTVEPGIYLPNFGGVRIEDDVVVTASGVERLTHSTKELLIVE